MLAKMTESEREIANLRASLVLPKMDSDALAAEERTRLAMEARKAANERLFASDTRFRFLKSIGDATPADKEKLEALQAEALAAGAAEGDAIRARMQHRAVYQADARAELFPAIDALQGAIVRRLDEIDELLRLGAELNTSALALGVDLDRDIVVGAAKFSRLLAPAVKTIATWR